MKYIYARILFLYTNWCQYINTVKGENDVKTSCGELGRSMEKLTMDV